MKKAIVLLALVASLSFGASATTTVKSVVKHPALVTRSVHGLKYVGKKSLTVVKGTGRVVSRLLF